MHGIVLETFRTEVVFMSVAVLPHELSSSKRRYVSNDGIAIVMREEFGATEEHARGSKLELGKEQPQPRSRHSSPGSNP